MAKTLPIQVGRTMLRRGEAGLIAEFVVQKKIGRLSGFTMPIKLIVSDGQRSVTARCTVPAKVADIATFTLDTLELNPPTVGPDQTLTLKMAWRDIPIDTNLYRVKASMSLEYGIPVYDGKKNETEKRISGNFNFQ